MTNTELNSGDSLQVRDGALEPAGWPARAGDGPPEGSEFGLEQQPPLGGKQLQVLAALVEGSSVAEAARVAGVGRATVFRWMKGDEAFRESLAAAQRRAIASTRNKLISLTDMAANVMRQRLQSNDLRAAMAILKSGGLMEPKATRKKKFKGRGWSPMDMLFPKLTKKEQEAENKERWRSLGVRIVGDPPAADAASQAVAALAAPVEAPPPSAAEASPQADIPQTIETPIAAPISRPVQERVHVQCACGRYGLSGRNCPNCGRMLVAPIAH